MSINQCNTIIKLKKEIMFIIHLIFLCIFEANHHSFVKGSNNEPLSQFWKYHRSTSGKGTLNNAAGIWSADSIEIPDIGEVGAIVDYNLERVLTIKNSGTAIESVVMEETSHFNGQYSNEQLWFVEGQN